MTATDHPCTVCGQTTRLRYNAPWCDTCEAWLIGDDTLIDLTTQHERARVISFDRMTHKQKAEHLQVGHGFRAYVEEAEDPRWKPLIEWPEEDLNDLHAEEAAMYDGGTGGKWEHTHDLKSS